MIRTNMRPSWYETDGKSSNAREPQLAPVAHLEARARGVAEHGALEGQRLRAGLRIIGLAAIQAPLSSCRSPQAALKNVKFYFRSYVYRVTRG